MELNLDLSLVYLPTTMSEFLTEVSRMKDKTEKLSKLDDYVNKLEDELRKIDAFKRELPLCMLLLNDAIVRLREEVMQCTKLQEHQNSEEEDGGGGVEKVNNIDSSDKRDWMSSVQLWSKQDSVSEIKLRREEDDQCVSENPIQVCNYSGRTFVPIFSGQSDPIGYKEVLQVSKFGSCNSMSIRNQVKCKSQQQQQQHASRKQRRCWSPDLHKRFVEALEQLGGSKVATPKQIRELMQVDGLTNDEVKSHLQKYRLHIRRLPNASAAQLNSLMLTQERCTSRSASPQGPFLANGSAKDISTSGGNSMEAEEEDGQSDGYSWKGMVHNHTRNRSVYSLIN